MTRGTTRAHVVRAALESLAFQTRDLIEAMARSGKKAGTGAARNRGAGGAPSLRVRALKVDGGASANDFLMQYQADLLGIPVHRPRLVETTALGAALLAGLATGFWTSQNDLGKARRLDRSFVPGKPRRWREQEYRRWQDAVEMLLAG